MNTKYNGFRKLGVLIIAAGAAVGACSPIAPSVSKLSSADASKTTPTDGSSPNSILGSAPGTITNSFARAATSGNGATQVTQLEAYTQFHSTWALTENLKPSLDLDAPTIAEFKTNGVTEFFSNNDRVKGQESTLAASKAVISIVLNADPATISTLGLGSLATSLTWTDGTTSGTPTPGHWQLVVVPPNTGDAVKDMGEFKQMLKALQDNLVNITVDFQAD